jgi:hypothetical protein
MEDCYQGGGFVMVDLPSLIKRIYKISFEIKVVGLL